MSDDVTAKLATLTTAEIISLLRGLPSPTGLAAAERLERLTDEMERLTVDRDAAVHRADEAWMKAERLTAERLAFGHHRLVIGGDGEKIACVYGPPSAANARLIAAAPETAAERVRQLEHVIKCTREVIIGHFDDGCDECANAVALIDLVVAKAEGR
ncbi:MAG: hypothetical protein HZA68_13105 [Rhodovulum sp.]|nr:hypothetical protein [Rhodovulum sp.]